MSINIQKIFSKTSLMIIKVGIPLELDVDFIDISTCESVPVSLFRILH